MLVISAHAADFVWRAGGAVALAASRGDRVKVLCLTYGERGESASAWRAGKTLEEIKALRRGEAESAAATLGAEIEFLDAGDYPLRERWASVSGPRRSAPRARSRRRRARSTCPSRSAGRSSGQETRSSPTTTLSRGRPGGRRDDLHPDLHPRPGARLDRGARRG